MIARIIMSEHPNEKDLKLFEGVTSKGNIN